MTVSPARYRTITVAALCSLIFIIVTGASVRLTASGLGCVDWPHCNSERFVDVSSKHAAIEQVNRLITGIVSVAVVAAVLGSWWRAPRRRDLVRLSVAMAAGVPAQALLGAVTVWSELNPFAVQAHMLLSLVLVALAVVLVHRAGTPDPDTPDPAGDERSAHLVRAWLIAPAEGSGVRAHVWVLSAITAVALVTGTVVTGAGPHAGSVEGEPVERFAVAITTAARVHSVSVLAAVATALVLAARLRRRPAERRQLGEWLTSWVFVAALQGALGYLQYFNDVPPLLVGIHVFGASVLWSLTVALVVQAGATTAATLDQRPVAEPALEPATR